MAHQQESSDLATSFGPTMAVFDFGKTNAKMLIFDSNGTVVASRRTAPQWINHRGRRVLDDAHLWNWMQTSLAEAAILYRTDRVTVTTHGCTFAMIADDHLGLPILDYEGEVPEPIRASFATVKPDFAETGSPDLPNGLNYGLQVYWMALAEPEAFALATAILPYPQFWIWRLTGQVMSEASFLGCHSHLWAPYNRDFSSLVDKMGWRAKMPALKRAGIPVGTYVLPLEDGKSHSLTVHNGVHDSNAALSFYMALGYSHFTLISTGTWVVIFNTDAPVSVMDEMRDMLANVTVDEEPVVTARFMGGREYDLISEHARVEITSEDIENAIAHGQMALPSFAPGGPFPGQMGRLIGPAPSDPRERAAVATLYLACMTHLVLDLVHSENTVIVDGGLSNNAMYALLLAALRPHQSILKNSQAEGTAAGAAALAFNTFSASPFTDPCLVCDAVPIAGLQAYYDEWRSKIKANN